MMCEFQRYIKRCYENLGFNIKFQVIFQKLKSKNQLINFNGVEVKNFKIKGVILLCIIFYILIIFYYSDCKVYVLGQIGGCL